MSEAVKLSLIIPCYNEEKTLRLCIERVLELRCCATPLELEILIVDDCSKDNSLAEARALAARHPELRVLTHAVNRGKGAAIRTGLLQASGDFIGIQDADLEYDPLEYALLLEPCLENKADVVYGSRYLRSDTRRVLYFWHTWMNRTLTFVSNMFTNLDISDMETCYKLFRREIIKGIAPSLKEERFGFEPEVTAKVAQSGARVYECAITYRPRSYEEGKKIGWRDGMHALYCILHYSASTAPLPMQILLYAFIGALSLLANVSSFSVLLSCSGQMNLSVITAYLVSNLVNYLLCILILFRHKARWSTGGEIAVYLLVVIVMGFADYGIMSGLLVLGTAPLWAKFWAASLGFALNFFLRRLVVFPEKKTTARPIA